MVAAEIRKLVALFALEMPPDVSVLPSITEVEVSSDLSYATIYVSALEQVKGAVKYLQDNKSEMKRRLARLAQGYKIPDLRFVEDDRSERGSRIDRILAEATVFRREEEETQKAKLMKKGKKKPVKKARANKGVKRKSKKA